MNCPICGKSEFVEYGYKFLCINCCKEGEKEDKLILAHTTIYADSAEEAREHARKFVMKNTDHMRRATIYQPEFKEGFYEVRITIEENAYLLLMLGN